MVDFEGLEQADVAAALAGPDLRPLLRALDLAGSDRPAPLITVPQPPSPGGPTEQVLCAVSCTAVDPAESDAAGSVLMLATQCGRRCPALPRGSM
ncbi:hypothetical protein [Streptomyces californicus]|uniref:hypothetical protein n=1 Tax=Streptomyces californicus TaxID=67351 RepID=UPI0033C51E8E